MSTYLEDNDPWPLPMLNIEKLKWTQEKDLNNNSFKAKKMTKKFYFSFSASNNPACLLDPTLAATTWKFFIGQSSSLVWWNKKDFKNIEILLQYCLLLLLLLLLLSMLLLGLSMLLFGLSNVRYVQYDQYVQYVQYVQCFQCCQYCWGCPMSMWLFGLSTLLMRMSEGFLVLGLSNLSSCSICEVCGVCEVSCQRNSCSQSQETPPCPCLTLQEKSFPT